MKNLFISLVIISSFSSLAIPVFAQTTTTPPPLDYNGLVKCDGVVTAGETSRQTACSFAAFVTTINSMVSYLFYISIPIATVLFAYAGLLYMTGSQGNIKKAKSVFTSVSIGFIIMLVAWVAVFTTVNWFLVPNSGLTTLVQTPNQ